MKNFTNNTKNPKRREIIVIIGAVLLLIFGVYSLGTRFADEMKYNELKEGGCYTYGTVDHTTRSKTEKRSYNYHAYGSYIVDGQEYEFSFKTSSAIHIGDDVVIYYEEGNPSNYMQEYYFRGSYVKGFLFTGISVALTIMLIISHFDSRKKTKSEYSVSGQNNSYYNTQQDNSGNVGSTAFYTRKK